MQRAVIQRIEGGISLCNRRVQSSELDRKIKTALNETRLLILGVQVLLGFEFQSFFQDGFEGLPIASKCFSMAALFMVIIAAGILVIPSMQHRLVEGGQSTLRLVNSATCCAGVGLAPLTFSLGLSAYVVIARHFGVVFGVTVGVILTGLAAFAWFGLELFLGYRAGAKRMVQSETPLATKIEQLLTEARVIIPGAQALFGFQFIAMLTSGFDRLPQTAKIVHATALCLIAVNVILLTTPAALHRLSFGGRDSEKFLRIGSALVVAAPLFLAGGIAAELYVVVQKTFGSGPWAATAAIAGLAMLLLFWYAFPLALRARL